MRILSSICTYAFSISTIVAPIAVQADVKPIKFEHVMTPKEIRDTGVDQLTAQERKALEKWLTRWTVRIMNSSNDSISSLDLKPNYAEESIDTKANTFQIRKNIGKGEKIELDDGSIWKIAPKYRRQSRLWLKDHSIILSKNKRNKGYSHQLFNLDLGVVVEGWKYELISSEDYGLEEDYGDDNYYQEEIPNKPSSFTKAKTKETKKGKYAFVEEVMMDGARLKLDDGTSWEINPTDRLDIQAWLPKERIKIERSGNLIYPQKLVNVENNESIEARLLAHD